MRGVSLLRLRCRSGELIFQNKNTSCRFYSSRPPSKPRNILKLHERGIFQDLFPDTSANQITTLLVKSQQCVYAGFDPTASSLHVGNLLVLMNLLHWQRGGHQPIAIIGGATGLIGDPSERTSEREPLDQATLNKNLAAIEENIRTIFANHRKYFWKEDDKHELAELKIINNIKWYKNMNVIAFVKDVGRHFRMGTMLGRSSVQSRLKSETGMSFAEFTYQVFQAYDWLCLMREHNCRFQVGGSDQMGNIVAGHELISRVMRKSVYGFTLPLITSEGGRKFGKSLNNAVWLSPERSSSFDMYQFFVRTEEVDVENYLKLFTFLSLPEIDRIMEEHRAKPSERKAQVTLAENVTLLCHGEEGLEAAQNATLLLFDKSVDSLSKMTQDQVSQAFEGANVKNLIFDTRMTVYNLAMEMNCFKSEHDAVRIIKAGGFYINYERITDPDMTLKSSKHILANNVTLLRTGKKTYHIVKWIELRRAEEAK